MYKVVIIDDEPLARELVAGLLESEQQFEITAQCGNGFEGFKAIQEQNPDLIFLDVQMPKLNGFEMLELIDEPPAVIFTTAFDEYAMKAFDAQALDYLLKPITQERFTTAINKFLQQSGETVYKTEPLADTNIYSGYQQRIVVKDGGNIRIIPAADIQYIAASDDYIKIHTQEKTYLKKSTLTSIEKSMNPKQFVRVHRSYIMPVSKLIKIEAYEKDSHVALLKDGLQVPVSKSGMDKLKQVLGW